MTLSILQAKEQPSSRLRQLADDLDWLTAHVTSLPDVDTGTARDVIGAASDLGQWVRGEIDKLSQNREVMS